MEFDRSTEHSALDGGCRSSTVEPDLYYAIGYYLLAHIERGQPGRALPRAVMSQASNTPRKLAAATRARAGEARHVSLERPRPPRLTQALQKTLLLLCETPFASVEDLSRMRHLPASSLRERLGDAERPSAAAPRPHGGGRRGPRRRRPALSPSRVPPVAAAARRAPRRRGASLRAGGADCRRRPRGGPPCARCGSPRGSTTARRRTLGAVIGQGARARVWQPARHGRGNTPVVKPDSSLAWLVDLAGREAEHPVRRVKPKRLWAWRSSGGARATPPGPRDLANAVVTQLGSAEKRMLDLLAGTSPLDAREGDHHRASARLAVPGGRSNERSEANGSIAYREHGPVSASRWPSWGVPLYAGLVDANLTCGAPAYLFVLRTTTAVARAT